MRGSRDRSNRGSRGGSRGGSMGRSSDGSRGVQAEPCVGPGKGPRVGPMLLNLCSTPIPIFTLLSPQNLQRQNLCVSCNHLVSNIHERNTCFPAT